MNPSCYYNTIYDRGARETGTYSILFISILTFPIIPVKLFPSQISSQFLVKRASDPFLYPPTATSYPADTPKCQMSLISLSLIHLPSLLPHEHINSVIPCWWCVTWQYYDVSIPILWIYLSKNCRIYCSTSMCFMNCLPGHLDVK